jgi:apolipoprotein N-acyltransferase
LVSGLVYFVGTTYWTGSVMRQYGDLHPVVAVLVMLALAAYLALYPATFALIVQWLASRLGPAALLLAPAVWVTTELGRGHLFTGFPWVLLGYSQTPVVPVAQLASVFGVYGLSALVALVNVALVAAVVERRAWRWAVVAGALAAVLGTVAWGSLRVRDGALVRGGETFRVGLIQGNVSQDQKWLPESAEAILESYRDMSREAAARGARLIIWPESSFPFYFEEDLLEGATVRSLASRTHTWILFGADQVERDAASRYFNAAFLVDPRGAVAGVYRKVHLVPFGEYVPLGRFLSFAEPLVRQVGGFSPGARMVELPVAGHRVSTEICYEIVYPELARLATEGGSELLTTITNDAWFGRSSAPWQHFDQAALRAVEQGRYLVRAANTGISGLVDPYGRVLVRSDLFEPVSIVGDIRFLTGRTIYARIGDAFAYACAGATAAALLLAVALRRPGL